MQPETFAAVVESCIRQALAPLVARLAEHDAAIKVQIKADMAEAIGAVEALGVRLEALETREPVPGPPGPVGAAGAPGPAGKDGAPGLQYCGVFVHGKSYNVGDAVTSDGSLWICRTDTGQKPGADGAWQLAVKRGRDARDREARP